MKSVTYYSICFLVLIMSCESNNNELKVNIYETSKSGNQLTEITDFKETTNKDIDTVSIDTTKRLQKITGFGGAFTESSAYLLNRLSKKNRDTIINAYFGREGANYSLTRTHMNSCDFSLSQYSYSPVVDDVNLEHFTIKDDMDDLIPMIKDAMQTSEDGFKIFASPWTAAPWMKDNNEWVGGKLLPKYYNTWALFFSKYIDAYKEQGIDIWGLTVENEPHGNGNNWESMHYTPDEMTNFVMNHLGPKLESDGHGDKIILGYDQNRAGLKEWVDSMYKDEETSKYFDGTAIHWYESTYEVFPEELQYAHNKAPNKFLIETEGCVDSEVPAWKDDNWYWSKEATDWGWDWASEEEKYLHP
ncbi:MAG: glycosyl hydrolase family 30, partial [Winogradskyella sp.]